MSAPDFISRLAARASAAASTARPRIRSRFEDVRGSDLTVVDSERPAARAPALRASRPLHTDASNEHRRESAPYATQRNDAPPTEDAPAATASPVARMVAMTESSRPPPVASEPAVAVHRTEHVVETHTDRTVVVRAVPVVAAATRVPPPSAGSGDATPVVEPAVRITIGRVEVRAAAPAPPALPAPRRPPRQTEALPLHDYLRGHRRPQ